MVTLTTGREDINGMEAVAQPPPGTASDRTTATGGGVASDRLRVHAHLYKPRLKSSGTVPDFQAELRQYASKQGRNAALEYATALGVNHSVQGPSKPHACNTRHAWIRCKGVRLRLGFTAVHVRQYTGIDLSLKSAVMALLLTAPVI